MLRVHRHDVELEEGKFRPGDGGAGIHQRIDRTEGNDGQQQALQDLHQRQLQTGVLRGEARLARDQEEDGEIEYQENDAHHTVKQHQAVHGRHIKEAVGHELGKEFEPLRLHVVGIAHQPVIQQGRRQQEQQVQQDILQLSLAGEGADGRRLGPDDGGKEGETQQGERQRHKGDQGADEPDQTAGGTAVPYLVGGIDGGNTAAQGDIKEIDAIGDRGLIIIGVGVGAFKGIGGAQGLHGKDGAGRSGHRLLAGQGRRGGIAIEEIGPGGNADCPAGTIGELKAVGILAGVIHAPQKAGEFIIGGLDGADVDRSGKQREDAVFGGDTVVGQVIDVAHIVVVAGKHQRTGQYDTGAHRAHVSGGGGGGGILAGGSGFRQGGGISSLPLGIGDVSALLDGGGAHRVAQHTNLGQIDKVVIGQLLQGTEGTQVGRVIGYAAHLNLAVALGRQAGVAVAVHIQRHHHIAAARKLNGIGLHGVQIGSIAMTQNHGRGGAFGGGGLGDIQPGMAGSAHVGGEGHILHPNGTARGGNAPADRRAQDHAQQGNDQHDRDKAVSTFGLGLDTFHNVLLFDSGFSAAGRSSCL